MAQKHYTSYDEWAADHMENGKLKDGVSYTEQRIGDYLLNQKNQYDAYDGKMKEQRDKAISDADILNQRMQKYLPQQLAAQGLYGTGISEDTYLKLQKQYSDSVSNANNTYSQGVSDYKLTMDAQIFDKVDAIRKEGEAEQKAAYNEAAAVIEAGFDTAQEYVEYVESVRDKVSEGDYNLLMDAAIANVKKNNSDTTGLAKGSKMSQAIEKDKINTIVADRANYDDLSDGDDIEVVLNGTTLTVESNGEMPSTEIQKYAKDKGMKEGTLFIYGNADTVYIYNGEKVYEVVSKNSLSDAYNSEYNDVRHYLQYGTYGDNVKKYKKNKDKTTNNFSYAGSAT